MSVCSTPSSPRCSTSDLRVGQLKSSRELCYSPLPSPPTPRSRTFDSTALKARVSHALQRHFWEPNRRWEVVHWTFIDIAPNDPDWIQHAECACCAATHFVEVLFNDHFQKTFVVQRYGVDAKHSRKAYVTSDMFTRSRHPYSEAKRVDNFFYHQFCAGLQDNNERAGLARSEAMSIPTPPLQRRGTLRRLIRRASATKKSSGSPPLPPTSAFASMLRASAPPPTPQRNQDKIAAPEGATTFFGVSCRRFAETQSAGSSQSSTPMSSPRTSVVMDRNLASFFDSLATPPSSVPVSRRNSQSCVNFSLDEATLRAIRERGQTLLVANSAAATASAASASASTSAAAASANR